jgi:hypothetical protein
VTLALLFLICGFGASFAAGYFFRVLIARDGRDARKALETCAKTNHCILRQIAETKEWTGELNRKMQTKLAERERRKG